jgi:glycosyltransferase involved in cell wall biosynthesis
MNIIWLGGIFTEETVKKYIAVNQAANIWSQGLLKALQSKGHNIQIVAHRPEPLWPRGSLFPGHLSEFEQFYPLKIITYVNIFILRTIALKVRYLRALKSLCRAFKPDVIISYNEAPWVNFAAGRMSTLFKIPWVPIILDCPNPGEGCEKLANRLSNASGVVFLSHWAYGKCPVSQPKLHLDGGHERWFGDESTAGGSTQKDKTLIYAGKYNLFGGIRLLEELLPKIQRKDLQIILCGKGYSQGIIDLAKNDARVKIVGYISAEELHQRYLEADLFLNIRPADLVDSYMNFPSKLLHYLAYGKPVVSNWSPGLSPEYRDILKIPETDTPGSFAGIIDKVLDWNQEEIIKHKEMVKNWFVASHTWNIQTENLTGWLATDITKSEP